MKARTRRRMQGALGLAGLTAVGAWFGFTKAAFFLPKWTIQRALKVHPSDLPRIALREAHEHGLSGSAVARADSHLELGDDFPRKETAA